MKFTTQELQQMVSAVATSDQAYEYRIQRRLPCLVQVRPARVKGQPRQDWRRYYEARSHQDAQRILRLLNEHAMEPVEAVVRA